MKVYLGLDEATIMGVALWRPDMHQAEIVQIKGDPLGQLHYLNENFFKPLNAEGADVRIVFEKQHDFRNAVTTRSILERYGFHKYTLLGVGYKIAEESPSEVRSFLGTSGKNEKQETMMLFAPYLKGSIVLTDNHTDALAVAIYRSHLDGYNFELSRLEITGMKP